MTAALPTVSVSIHQPWAWLIVAGFKPVENRTWATKHRGPVLIHASARPAFSVAEASALLERCGAIPRPLQDVSGPGRQCGGIVGVATVADCVRNHPSPWAMPGHWHWVLTDARPLGFMPCRGRLGFFNVNYIAPAAECGQGVLA